MHLLQLIERPEMIVHLIVINDDKVNLIHNIHGKHLKQEDPEIEFVFELLGRQKTLIVSPALGKEITKEEMQGMLDLGDKLETFCWFWFN
jgi:thiamine monophosphate synthase